MFWTLTSTLILSGLGVQAENNGFLTHIFLFPDSPGLAGSQDHYEFTA